MRPAPTDLEAFVPAVYMVRKRRRETADTVTLMLTPGDGGRRLPAERPGQFNMLYAHGVGEIPVSVSGADDSGALLHTIRDVGAVSGALCRLRVGESLGIRGPYGTPWPIGGLVGRNVAVMAGGLGLAPLRLAIRQLARERERYGEIRLCYGARAPRDVLYAREWAAWRRRGIEVGVAVDRTLEPWSGRVGVVTALLPRALPEPERWSALLCGPEVMMRHSAMDLIKRGVAKDQIYVSLERNMKCAVGLCGHCQLAPLFICRDGPVVTYAVAEPLLGTKGL